MNEIKKILPLVIMIEFVRQRLTNVYIKKK